MSFGSALELPTDAPPAKVPGALWWVALGKMQDKEVVYARGWRANPRKPYRAASYAFLTTRALAPLLSYENLVLWFYENPV
jgi:hypothetical protein